MENLVVFGGDTLYGIINRLDCKGISPVGEISPGVVSARIKSDIYNFSIITKAGGLGDERIVGAIDEFIFGAHLSDENVNRGDKGRGANDKRTP